MRLAGLVVVVVACASPTATPEPEPGPMCGPPCVCGNGIVERCAYPQGLGCYPSKEECDGTLGASCTEYGYYGGAGVCSGCRFDSSGCNACAVTCIDVPLAYDAGPVLAASQTNIAVAHVAEDGPSILTLDASLNQVARAQVSYSPVGMVAVPDGWLLIERNNPYLFAQHVDMAGSAASSPQPIGDCEIIGIFGGVAYGPGGRALVLCNYWPTVGAMEPGRGVGAFIIDANGAVVVQPFKVHPPAIAAVGSVTTDGTSFFVAAGGQLAVVTSDGTISSRIAGYPMGDGAIVSWSGSSGWYVAPSDTTAESYIAQAFDATGAKVGLPISIHAMSSTSGLQAFSTGLVGTSFVSSSTQQQRRFGIARVDATGAVVATTEVGVVATLDKQVVVSFGTGVAVAWSTANTAHVALVTP